MKINKFITEKHKACTYKRAAGKDDKSWSFFCRTLFFLLKLTCIAIAVIWLQVVRILTEKPQIDFKNIKINIYRTLKCTNCIISLVEGQLKEILKKRIFKYSSLSFCTMLIRNSRTYGSRRSELRILWAPSARSYTFSC